MSYCWPAPGRLLASCWLLLVSCWMTIGQLLVSGCLTVGQLFDDGWLAVGRRLAVRGVVHVVTFNGAASNETAEGCFVVADEFVRLNDVLSQQSCVSSFLRHPPVRGPRSRRDLSKVSGLFRRGARFSFSRSPTA